MKLKRLVYYLNSPAYDYQVIAFLLVQFWYLQLDQIALGYASCNLCELFVLLMLNCTRSHAINYTTFVNE